MKDLTVVIPVFKMGESNVALYKKALDSITDDKVTIIVIGNKEDIAAVKGVESDKKITFVENKDNDYSTQVNTAAKKVKTKYFSILQYDDEFGKHYFENTERYTTEMPEISVFLSLHEVYDFQKPELGAVGYINEPFWASSFSDEIGCPDEDSIMNYLDMNFSGAIFNKEDFQNIGGLKPSIKLTFWHEFALRAVHNEKKMYVIPKACYKTNVNRPGSYLDTVRNTMSEAEANWWVNLAEQEFYFKNDRNKTYEETKNNE